MSESISITSTARPDRYRRFNPGYELFGKDLSVEASIALKVKKIAKCLCIGFSEPGCGGSGVLRKEPCNELVTHGIP